MAADREDHAISEVGRAAVYFGRKHIAVTRHGRQESLVREVRVERIQAMRGRLREELRAEIGRVPAIADQRIRRGDAMSQVCNLAVISLACLVRKS